uniref:Histidine-containing phosphotransfer protein n=1 Tax=Aegilops tauschii subsp. strangulata TaxID=200361 RepID=A0A453H098_AEGTS
MAAAALKAQLNALLDSMFTTGIVDEAFQHLRSVEQEGFLAEVVNLFLQDADNILNEVAHLLSIPRPLRPPSPSALVISCWLVLISSALSA